MIHMIFFRIVDNKKLFRGSSVKYQTFWEDLTWSDLIPYGDRKNEKPP